MSGTTIKEIIPPVVSVDEVYRAGGADYSKRAPRPGVAELHRLILMEAAALVRPMAAWREVQILGVEGAEVFLAGGQKLTSRLLAKVAGKAERLILFAMTIGNAIDDRVADYSKAGNIMEAFTLDAAGTAFIASSSKVAIAQLNERYRADGMNITFPMGPGHSYWDGLEDMRTIFSFLDADQIGIRLTDSNLMLPRKSIAMVMGVGCDLKDFGGKTHCDFCNIKKTCKMSNFTGVC